MSTSPYTASEMASILKSVKTDKGRVEKIVVGAANEYVRSLSLPRIPRPNPAREIAALNQALQSLVRALDGLSGESRGILDDPERRDPAYRDASREVMDSAALSNAVHCFMIENKIGLEIEVKDKASPGRPDVDDKRRLLKRLNFAFEVGHSGERRPRGRPKFLTHCAAPEKMNLRKKEGTTNWWDDLDRKKPGKNRRD
jgi:hypothetical protein